MKNSYLKEQIKILQKEYGTVLKLVVDKLSTDDFALIIDEINLFWFTNRELVRIILNNISYEYNCYAFTGASFLDIDDFEHYPFITLGDIHIVDDPLCKYAGIVSNIPNGEFAEKMKEQIVFTAKDNIKIIDNYSEIIYILPITLLSDMKTDLIKKANEQAFISMFNDKTLTIMEYLKKFNTIEDVSAALKEKAKETIIFSDDNKDTDLISRFRHHIMGNPLPFESHTNEAMVFYFLISGFFTQAFTILLTCAEYKMIPYLRYNVTFRYTMLLGDNFSGNKVMEDILFKCACAHLLYKIFDKSKIQNLDFQKYYGNLQRFNFSERVFNILNQSGIDLKNASVNSVVDVLQPELDRALNSEI